MKIFTHKKVLRLFNKFKCTKCNGIFSNSQKYGPKYTSCKECHKKLRRNNYLLNKERDIKQVRIWQANNKEKVYAYIKKWNAKNKDKVAIYQKRSFIKNKPARLAYRRKYNKKNWQYIKLRKYIYKKYVKPYKGIDKT